MRLYLLRHLAPIVAPGVCYGRSDLAAEPIGTAARNYLRAQLPAGAPVFSSPLRRCTQLAGILADAPPIIDARLAELDFGNWEMRRWDAIERAEIDAWALDTAMYRPGGGERVFDMAQRVHSFYHALPRADHDAAIVVCHAGTIRLLVACQRGLEPEEMAREAAARPHAIDYGALLTLDDRVTT